MSILGNSYQFDTAIIWWQDGSWVHIADQFGSFMPMRGERFVNVIVHGFYLPLLQQAGLPATEGTINYAVRLYCKEFNYQYICLN